MSEEVDMSAGENKASLFLGDSSLTEKLDKARTELLDLSARNRLLNMPRSSKGAKSIEVVDEKSTEVFRMLSRDGRTFTFAAGKLGPGQEDSETEEVVDLAQPENDDIDDRGVFARHSDTRLQTRLTQKGLQKRLLDLSFDARTLEEEQGVNILFLALGALKWIDPSNASNIRFAPLILIPVELQRGNAGEKFKLRARAEEFSSNLSLETFLDRVHAIKLPQFEATEAFELDVYLAGVAEAISEKPGWAVIPDDITLGFFSFAKFLMYRDLDSAAWPTNASINDRPLIRGLLAEGFSGSDGMISEDANIDGFISPADMLHIVDSDSSQTLAVHEVRRGRNMVIQGPPGTGKSQTIANIVSSAIADGKTVLFVAEKMAALEVVKRRLDATGVGDACLELHSNKANKRALLDELRRTWELGVPRLRPTETLHARLTEARDKLNSHSFRIHARHVAANLSPYEVIGQLCRLKLENVRPNNIRLASPETWSRDGFAERHEVLAELVERVHVIGQPTSHPWRGVALAAILPTDVERLTARIDALKAGLEMLDSTLTALASTLECEPPAHLNGFAPLCNLARRIERAPSLSDKAIADPVWDKEVSALDALLATVEKHQRLRGSLADSFIEAAWETDIAEARAVLTELPPAFSTSGFKTLNQLIQALPRFLLEVAMLAKTLGRDAPRTVVEASQLLKIGERVASAPDASPEAFAADLWTDGVDRASDLVSAVVSLEAARSEIGSGLLEAAWTMDLAAARSVLASHGTGFFRRLSGEWRKANHLIRSVLASPDQSLQSTLALLDALSKGQSAKRLIDSEDGFGRSAFGAYWRADRSTSAPLLALVEWMRSLKGLGAEPRLIAARRPERSELLARVQKASAGIEGIHALLAALWSESGAARCLFEDVLSADRFDLVTLLTKAKRFQAAEIQTSAVLKRIPDLIAGRLQQLDSLMEGQASARAIKVGESLGLQAFRQAWLGASSNWSMLRAATDWVKDNADIRLLVSRMVDCSRPAALASSIENDCVTLLKGLRELSESLRLDLKEALGISIWEEATIAALATQLDQWRSNPEQLSQWVAYRDRADRGRSLGCSEVVDQLADGRLPPADVLAAFEMAYFEALYADQVRLDPELARFDGMLHTRIARDFADLDRQRIAAASLEVVSAHHKRIPARDGGAIGPLGVLRGEIQKKRGHIPIRKLMERAGPAVQAMKPVFMMSPLSVAQFLVPGSFEFDLLVMDEASQIQPVEALGAVARCKQVVVVGDPKQLPPTAFFSKMTGASSDDEDEDGTRVADIESILGLFTARGLPTRMLRWHYRSKHQSLIAVSNKQFYESKLFIVPSPYTAEAGMGLRFHHISQGLFDAGSTRTNAVEAKIVAQAIVRHASEHPGLSLGVVAFSVAQRRAILDQLEILRRALPPEVEAFFQTHFAEPFFIKNLENVQGDERDVIFISVGYGPTVLGGRVPMRFGPLGSDGGERRLNVLISRAKQRCEVFSSMSDEDIDPDFAASRKGVFAFRLFLHYARTGKLVMAEATGRDHGSVFEEQVAKALLTRGYQVHRQVGLAGFFIDLAVADSERPGRYLLGIECDGAAYHDARSARDRDRLRQSVLESHGWAIHRIWSTDWFQRPSEQLSIVIARIEAAKAEHDAQVAGTIARSRAVPIEVFSVERENITEMGLSRSDGGPAVGAVAYIEAVLTSPAHRSEELHLTPTGILVMLVEEAVRIEGPVHVDEVINRIRDAWGLKRAGSRIQEVVEAAVTVAVNTGRITRDASFLSLPGLVPLVRDRAEASSQTLRRADMLPPAEITVAVLHVVKTNFGATIEQIIQAVSRLFGIKSTSNSVREAVLSVIERLRDRGELSDQSGILTAVNPQSTCI